MAFYSLDAAMEQQLAALMTRLAPEAPLAITWLRYPRSLLPSGPAPGAGSAGAGASLPGAGGSGASWGSDQRLDPGDLVQLVYLIAVERWLQQDRLAEDAELRRAAEAMIRRGSHEATSHVLDCLSGTTGGPALAPWRLQAWQEQRQLVDGWLQSLGWPELQGCRALQKTWQDGPYGREREAFGPEGEHANRFGSEALARLLEAVLAGTLISPPACLRLRSLLADPSLPAALELPARLELAAATPELRLWGKAGCSGQGRGLALHAEAEGKPPVLLVLLTGAESPGLPDGLLGRIAAELLSGAATDG